MSAMLRDSLDQMRMPNTLRCTYTYAELHASTEIHALTRQLGTQVEMLERYHSKLSATTAVGRSV